MSTRAAPLAGLRILALEQMQALPYATQLLARLGAEVVKVEHPERGDLGRGSQPQAPDAAGVPAGATYLRNNSAKRSIGVDLASETGQDLIRRLAPKFDVVAENFKPGALARYGLDYASLAAVHPPLVYGSISGFGHTTDSPYGHWPAFAPIAEAMSGMYIFKRPTDQPVTVSPVGALGDTGSGLFAAVGLLAALRHRDATGEGSHVDIAMADCMVAFADVVPNYWSMGLDPRAVPPLINHGFALADGEIVMQIGRPYQFARLAEVLGHPEWVDDDRFADPRGWVDHLDVIGDALATWAADRRPVEVADALARAGIAAAPVFDAADLAVDPHVAARSMLTPVADDVAGRGPVLTAGNPVRLTGPDGVAAGDDPTRPPGLGADTAAVLAEDLDLSPAQIAALRDAGTIA